jgi:hypothetical protein
MLFLLKVSMHTSVHPKSNGCSTYHMVDFLKEMLDDYNRIIHNNGET